jgi:hypothetical protein
VRALLAAAALAVALSGCGGGGKSTATGTIVTVTNPTGTAASVTTHGRFHYSQTIARSYMKACTKGGAVKESACACTLDKLSNSVSSRDFSRMTLSGKIPPRIRQAIVRAANDCRGS